MLKLFSFACVALIIGLALWFRSWNGPDQLDFADRIWPGAAQAKVTYETGIIYNKSTGQKLDIYIPASTPKKGVARPVLLFFYGGSWRDGARGGYGFLGRAFAARGFVTVIADYRKIPQYPFPAFVEDAADAIAWTHNTISTKGGDPDRLFIMGHSAGAHIAMMATLDPRWLARNGLNGKIIKGVIGLAGPYDFRPFTTDATKAAFGSWPNSDETQPITYARADAPPLLLLTGDSDVTVKPRNSAVLAAKMVALGGHAKTKAYKGLGHLDIIMAVARPFRGKAPIIQDILAFTADTK